MKQELQENGYYIYRNVLDEKWLGYLRVYVNKALEEAQKYGADKGTAINALVSVPEFANLLSELRAKGILDEIEKNYFNSKYIVNSFSALNNFKGNSNFSGAVHRDIRFFSGNCNIMLNILVFVDDFTIENGATLVYPKSHHNEKLMTLSGEPPIQLTGKAGDIAIWNSNLYHAAMPNTTDENRRGIPIVFCKSNFKQLLDYPKALKDKEELFSEDIKQLLGFDAIVPNSLEEWYYKRTYKKGQD